MATKKKLLQAAAGSAGGGAGALNVEDVFSTYLYEGNGSSKRIQNGVNLGQSYGSGSLEFDGSTGYVKVEDATAFDVGSNDDYTVEMWVYFITDPNNGNVKYLYDGKASSGTGGSTFFLAQESTNDWSSDGMSGNAFLSSDFTSGQWYHIAITRSSGTVRSFKNGTVKYTGSGTETSSFDTDQFNIGARYTNDFILSNAYISNFRFVNGTALYTSNFTPSTSELTAVTNTALLTLQGTTPLVDNSSNANTVTANGTTETAAFGPFDAADAGEGGLVWFKARTGTRGGQFYDTERGVTKRLVTTVTDAESTLSNGLTSFNASGFTVGGHATVNQGLTYASWTFRKAPKFFTCLTYSGTGSVQNISHDLGSVPAVIITKETSGTSNWAVYHRSLGKDKVITLNSTNAASTNTNYWNDTAPTSTEFTLGSTLTANQSGETYVAYLFAHNDGDGEFGPDGDADIIKCGSYTGNGSSTGPEIDLGFEPQWVLVKDATSANNWLLFDNMRGLVTGGNDALLRPNLADAELTSVDLVEATSTGFRIPTNDAGINGSGNTYIYIAIRRGPMAVPESATDVFAIDQGINSSVGDRVFNSGFPVDLMIRTDPTTTYNRLTIDRLRGNGAFVTTNLPDAETDTAYGGEFDDMEGVFTDTSFDFSNHYAYMWQRRPNYLDIVAYTGNSPSSGRAISHNLGVVPEMIWVKNRNGASGGSRSWIVYHKDTGNSGYLKLNTTDALITSDPQSKFGNGTVAVAPTSTDFTVAGDYEVNFSGDTYVAYLFASLSGISKCGSYTGNGSSQTIDCGFSSGARFVLIKDVDTAGEPWRLYDTARGLVAGDDAQLLLDASSAQITSGFDLIDPDSSGFALPSSIYTNNSGVTYIFYAIA